MSIGERRGGPPYLLIRGENRGCGGVRGIVCAERLVSGYDGDPAGDPEVSEYRPGADRPSTGHCVALSCRSARAWSSPPLPAVTLGCISRMVLLLE